MNQILARRMLEKAGHRVVVVNDGQEAVTASAAHRFDICLMDVEMPRMDGFAATIAIRAREAEQATDHLPIVAVTAHALSEYRERCAGVGMNGYLAKPVLPEALDHEIARVLEALAPA